MTATSSIIAADLSVDAEGLDPKRAAAIYLEHGALVVRGLMQPYLAELRRDIEAAAAQAIALLDQARKTVEGWVTPDGTLFLPAPPGFQRDKQIMVLAVGYGSSGAFFRSALHPAALDIVEAVVGPNIEMFLGGQCLYKEPLGGHPKLLHQDAAYFEHRFEGPVGILSYAVDTTVHNGALHVIPGSHHWGVLKHVDTFSHLGLDPKEWTWDKAVAIEGKAGDAIFFHVKTVHGSPENRSAAARPVFIHRYRRPDDYITVSATTAENRALAEKRAAEARKENQMGFMVRGFRKYEPESARNG